MFYINEIAKHCALSALLEVFMALRSNKRAFVCSVCFSEDPVHIHTL